MLRNVEMKKAPQKRSLPKNRVILYQIKKLFSFRYEVCQFFLLLKQLLNCIQLKVIKETNTDISPTDKSNIPNAPTNPTNDK